MRQIKEIIVHCSGTDICSYDFASMKYDHMKNRGWSDIGYHFGIDWDADIHILRPINKAGAHCLGRNAHSIGICVLGLQTFTTWQMSQLGKLCETLCMIFDLEKSDIKPHNYYNTNKLCPNFDFNSFLDKYVMVN